MFDSETATRTADVLERIAPEDRDGDLGRIANTFDEQTKNWGGAEGHNGALDYLWNISTQLERIANAMEQKSKATVVETQQ